MPRFVSRPLEPQGDAIAYAESNVPPLPAAFRWDDRDLEVADVLRTWRSTKDDRGDTYLKRHWFEFVTRDGARAVVYYDREARRGAPHWWLFTIDEA